MDKSLVSICIPNFNNEKYLDACIQSALAQTYHNTEVIFIDDCSTDHSLEIAKKYEGNMRILQNVTNLGQPKNTQKCIESCTGKYVVILHSDDFLLPHFAEKLVPVLECYPNIAMAIGERMVTDETGVPSKITPFYKMSCIIPGEMQAKVFMMTSVLPCQVLFNRETLIKAGGVDERYIVNLDGLLWFKCALVGDVGYIQEPVAVYRTHAENATAQYLQSIDLIVEHYCTLTQMFRLAKGRLYLEQFFDAAIKRVGHLALRYCHRIFRLRNFDLVNQYLALAIVFDPELINNQTYRTLKYCAESDGVDRLELYQSLMDTIRPEIRSFSYDPPEGFFVYED